MIKHCSFVCAAAKAGPGPIGRSRHLFLVALPALSRAAVMPAMGTKSREVIWGGPIMGAEIHARHAREEPGRFELVTAVDPSSRPRTGICF
jgi:hypothetical protein